jgi:hypothetical protein
VLAHGWHNIPSYNSLTLVSQLFSDLVTPGLDSCRIPVTRQNSVRA